MPTILTSQMGLPNVFLSMEYFEASSRALCETPIAPAATGGRVLSKAPMASLKPIPSPANTFCRKTIMVARIDDSYFAQ